MIDQDTRNLLLQFATWYENHHSDDIGAKLPAGIRALISEHNAALDLLSALCIPQSNPYRPAGLADDNDWGLECIYCHWSQSHGGLRDKKGTPIHDENCPIRRGAALVAKLQEANDD